MNDVSFSARRVGLADPFGSAQIPFTIELYESDKLVASESFTWLLEDKLEEITTFINNTPKLDERYKMLIRYDVPEGNGNRRPNSDRCRKHQDKWRGRRHKCPR